MSVLTPGKIKTQRIGDTLAAAGKKTDADTTDRTITADFNHVSVVNNGPSELRLAVDEDSTAGGNIIYVEAGEAFEAALLGSVLHYSIASGSATFRYVLS